MKKKYVTPNLYIVEMADESLICDSLSEGDVIDNPGEAEAKSITYYELWDNNLGGDAEGYDDDW